MLKALFDSICERGVRARSLDVIELPGEPNHVYGTYDHVSNCFTRREAQAGPRRHTVHLLDDFVSLFTGMQSTAPLVFCGRTGVVGLVSVADDRRQTVRFPLTETQPFVTLSDPKEMRLLSHKELVALLRIHLHGCVPSEVLQVFRNLSFDRSDIGESSSKQGAESLSRQTVNQVMTGGEPPPEEVVVTVDVFEEISAWPQVVRCAVDIDYSTALTSLIPLAGELEASSLNVRDKIATFLREHLKDVTVVCGDPGPPTE